MSTTVLILLVSGLVGISILMIVMGFYQTQNHRSVQDRLSFYLEEEIAPQTAREIEMSQPFSERMFLPFIRRVMPVFQWMWPSNRVAALQKKITMAGDPLGLSAQEFVGLKGLCMVLLGGLAFLFVWAAGIKLEFTSILMLLVLLFAGFFVPDFWLSRQVTARQQSVIRSMPDAMDMLVITVEAGLSFESGIQEIVNKWNNPLGWEFKRVLRDIGTGMRRRDAMLGLVDRTEVSEVANFVTALNQAEELGVGLGRVLRIQSEEMRTKRRQRAQEKANQAPIKMMIPLVFLVFPAIFAVLLGPAVPQLLNLNK